MVSSVDLALVAGEASGDLLAGLLLRGLRTRLPGLTTHGIGGPHMVAQGFRADWPSDKLAVRGYAEVLRHLPGLLALRRRLGSALIATPPAAFIGVDAPDFNLGLETRLRRAAIPVIHFVSPSIWAWRKERIHTIAQAVDHMLVLLPFEEQLYRDAGIAATYVGHPLADEIPVHVDQLGARRQLGLAAQRRVVALMPGSRLAEIGYNGPTFIRAAQRLLADGADCCFVAPMASQAARLRFEALLRACRGRALELTILDGQAHQVLAACDAALIASGTATLEAALYRRPMVVAYRMAAMSYALMKNKGYLPWVALPNILAGEFLVPEFIQHQATPEQLAKALRFQLDDEPNRIRLEQRFSDLHTLLRRDTAKLSATVIAEFLQQQKVAP